MGGLLGSEIYSECCFTSSNAFNISLTNSIVQMRMDWWKMHIILLFNVFLLLFIGLITLFRTIYESYCIILTNFYLYLQYFQQKVFSFNKINGFQIDPMCWNFLMKKKKNQWLIYSNPSNLWVTIHEEKKIEF